MLVNIRYKEVKVRLRNSHLFKGEKRYTGTVTYSVVGTVDRAQVRLSLGTEDKNVAIRRVSKIEKACAEGATSGLWHELEQSLPYATFKFFADRAGYVAADASKGVLVKPTWQALVDSFKLEMERKVVNRKRGASRKEGTLADSTRNRYLNTIANFSTFVPSTTLLDDITPATIDMFKTGRHKEIKAKKQSRGGGGVATDIAILHGMFKYAFDREMLRKNPINFSKETKPGSNPANPARPFNADELQKLRKCAKEDFPTFLLLLKTGLRGGDAIRLQWNNIHFDRGANGEVEILTEKRQKLAIIPLTNELRNLLEEVYKERKPKPVDQVLWNPETGSPFAHRARMYERIKKLGIRAGLERATPHCFRDTFACDCLARGISIYDVAKMLADTVDTVEKSYAQFIPAARDAAQSLMANGIGIEERAKLAEQRGKKVVGFPG
jgi:integrase